MPFLNPLDFVKSQQQARQDNQPQGVFDKADAFLNKPSGQFLMNLLAQSGYSTMPGSPLGAVGRAGVMTQHQQQQQRMQELQSRLIEARLGRLGGDGSSERFGKINPSNYTPASLEAYNQSGNFGDLVPVERVGSKPAAVSEYEYFSGLSDDEKEDYIKLKRRTAFEDVPGLGVLDPNTGNVVVDEETYQDATSDRTRAEVTARKDPERLRSLPGAIQRKQEKIKRIDRFVQQLEDGTLDTGKIQQYFSRFTPAGEDFNSFAGEEVLNLISSATFGALSEGERKFLENIAFSLGKDEEVNKRDLIRLREILEKAIEIESQDLERISKQDSDRFEGFSIQRDQ